MRRIAPRDFGELRSQKHSRSNLLSPPDRRPGISLSLSRALVLRRLKSLDVMLLSALNNPTGLDKTPPENTPQFAQRHPLRSGTGIEIRAGGGHPLGCHRYVQRKPFSSDLVDFKPHFERHITRRWVEKVSYYRKEASGVKPSGSAQRGQPGARGRFWRLRPQFTWRRPPRRRPHPRAAGTSDPRR